MNILCNDALPPLPDAPGVFDSFLLCATNSGYRTFALEQHFHRFTAAAATHNLRLITFEELLKHIESFIHTYLSQKTAHQDYHLRLQVARGDTDVNLVGTPFKKRIPTEGATLVSYQSTRTRYETKYTPATESIKSMEHAKNRGASEALFIDQQNVLTETSWGNFFWIESDGTICTSARALPGIVRANLLKNLRWKSTVAQIELDTLLERKLPCFITNALHGVSPVTHVDSIALPSSSVTHDLVQWWNDRLQDFSHLTFFPSRK